VLDGVTRDKQSVTADWTVLRDPIEGVALREVRNVVKDNGWVTELYRRDWGLDDLAVDQAFQVALHPGGVSAWHCHRSTTDRLFVTRGDVKLVLYDDRDGSPTHGRLDVFRLGERRPGLVLVPPDVWHGVQNVGTETATIVNLVDRAYDYDDPDHWRVPADHPDIPHTW
jgi:dTDP-4-dehydrorhamnose 3,5-epimerase